MTTLRERVIEAGTRAFHDPGVELHDDDRHLVALVLDAVLDCLIENEGEWDERALALATSDNPPMSMMESFITALRDSP